VTESKESLRSFAGDRATESAVEIREAQPRDCVRIADLANQLGYPSSADEIAHRLAGMKHSNEHVVFVAQLGDEIAGWIGAYFCRMVEADARAEISGLVVDERYRSQGVGPLLLDRAEQWAREKGCRTIGLRSNAIRDRAHSFYERHGYVHTKTQKSFRKDL
jgi:GNAT superfamily N-acetyltransferase